MNDRNRRSAAEVMANAARVVKAAVNIVRAAIAGGLHGAAAAAAKELLPTIIKFALVKPCRTRVNSPAFSSSHKAVFTVLSLRFRSFAICLIV